MDCLQPSIHPLVNSLLNIGRNAIQAMLKEATIKPKLKIITRSERQIIFHKKKHSAAIRIDIIDNGPGIPKNINYIFFTQIAKY